MERIEKMKDMSSLHLRLPKDLRMVLEAKRKRTGNYLTTIIRDALDDYFREELKALYAREESRDEN